MVACYYITIIGGDTIALPCATPFRGCAEKVRLLSIDAPETYRPHCDSELAAGLTAKERLAALLRAGPVEIERHGQDRYRRTLANVLANGRNVGDVLMAERLALPYRPDFEAHRYRTAQWCGPGNW